MFATLEQRAPTRGKDTSMARRKKPRPYGSGILVELKGSFAIRWWETVIGADGEERRKMGYENLGDIPKKEAESRLQEKLTRIHRTGPRQEQVIPTFSEHAARFERDILSLNKFSTRMVRKTMLDTHLIP